MAKLLPLQLGACFAVVAFVATPAHAQESFGEANPFVLSLEHLGGVSYSRLEADGSPDGATTSIHAGVFTTQVPFLGPQSRLGLHYFVSGPISLGALLSYSDNGSYGETALVGARVGYAMPVGESTALWLRGGFLYARTKLGSQTTISDLKPGAEALFVLHPTEHFGIIVGGMFEMGVAGKIKTKQPSSLGGPSTENETDFKQMEVALTLGVLADL
jgi:hypothetical protein